jgi:arylsulfatase A-like enzyme
VLDALNKSGLAQNTYVIFTSDNGGTRQYVAPLRGGKGTLYQGGIRVPAILRGPGIPSGRHSPVATLSMDWYPTVLDLAGVQASDGIPLDGRSLASIAKGQGTLPARDVFWHFPCYIGGGGPCSAMLSGDWKLIEFFESGTTELYNLSQDPGEKIDLTASEPGRSAELLAKLHVWQDETQAPRPNAANSAYDPSATGKPGRQDQDNTGGKNLQRRHPKDPSQS